MEWDGMGWDVSILWMSKSCSSQGRSAPKGLRYEAQGWCGCVCAPASTLGNQMENKFNPNGVALIKMLKRPEFRNPFGVVVQPERCPRVGAARQPWASKRSPFGAATIPVAVSPVPGRMGSPSDEAAEHADSKSAPTHAGADQMGPTQYNQYGAGNP